jgi:N-acetylglucosaminyl-diphospho-decaprenol L-rhamnosyltransferase
MRASIIVVSYNTRDILAECLVSLFAEPGIEQHEVFVVDNDSKDGSAAMVAETFPTACLIDNRENIGFAAANNQAYARSLGDYIILLNPDATLKPGSLDRALTFMEAHPACGVCGGLLLNAEGERLPSARRFPNALTKLFMLSGLADRHPQSRLFGRYGFGYFDHRTPLQVDWVPGTFAVFRRNMLTQIGMFDERYFLYYEETDLCLRAKRNGWQVFFTPDAEIMHLEGASSKTRDDEEFEATGSQVLKFRMRAEALYFRKNFGVLSVILNMLLVEAGWHLLRWLVNCLPNREQAAAKRRQSMEQVKSTLRALCDTRMGRVSPPRPW